MQERALPLQDHPSFSATTADALLEAVSVRLGASIIAAATPRSLNALANHRRLTTSELWFCSYGTPLSLRFGGGEYLRLQLPHRGRGATWIGSQLHPVTAQFACVSAAEATIDFQADFEQIVWRVDQAALSRKLGALVGVTGATRLQFRPTLRLDTSRARALMAVVNALLEAIRQSKEQRNDLVIAELEHGLMTSLLTAGEHNLRSLFDAPPKLESAATVRRAEEYLAAHLELAFDVEALAAHCNTSVRSLYRTFRKLRGETPMQFLKQQRLLRAERLLTSPDNTLSVTEIAFACGFADLSQFSRDFARAFGTPPSQALRRVAGTHSK